MQPSRRLTNGFTLIEVLITLVIMVILLGLGVAAMGNIQAQARDSERQQDVETIARGLEIRYNQGNPVATAPAPEAQKGSYPGVNEMIHAGGDDRTNQGYNPPQVEGGYMTRELPGTNDGSFTNPGGNAAFAIVCLYACAPAGNSAQISAAFSGGDGDLYVYEPIDASGNICCCGNCTHFNLYWKSETDSTIYNGIAGLKIVRSKHR